MTNQTPHTIVWDPIISFGIIWDPCNQVGPHTGTHFCATSILMPLAPPESDMKLAHFPLVSEWNAQCGRV